MTSTQLNIELNKLLKAFIKSEGLYSSGKLYKSVDFKTSYRDGKFSMNLKAMDYIQYVEDGELLDKFFNLNTVEDVITEFIVAQMFL